MTVLTKRMREQLFSLSASDDDIMLVTITHADWADPLRFASRGIENEEVGNTMRFFTTHDGEEYEAALVSALLPDDEENELPSMPIVIDNIGYEASVLLDEELQDATVDLVCVAKSDPDEILDEARGFKVVEGDCVNATLTLDIALDPGDDSEPACAFLMGRDNAPGLFL